MQNRNAVDDPALDGESVAVRRSRNGRGLFATRSFRAGDTITRIPGRVVHWKLLWKIGGEFQANCIRFGPETYLDPGEGPGRWLNHSCEPNAALRKVNNQVFVFAAAPVRAGAELTIDYSTTIGDDDVWTMRCNCGRRTCRRRIRNIGSLPAPVRDEYIAHGMVPRFILATLQDAGAATRSRTPQH